MAEFQTENITSTATGSATGSSIAWPGGVGNCAITGTYSSGTAKLQYRLNPNFNFVDVGTHVTGTADFGGNFELPQCTIRAQVTGIAGTSPNLDVWVGVNKVRDVKKDFS